MRDPYQPRAAGAAVATVAALALGACLQPQTRQCGDLVCPAERMCAGDPPGCFPPNQVSSCDGKAVGSDCQYEGISGRCDAGVCVAVSCGDDVIDPGEDCDGTALGDNDCQDLDFYEPDGLACNSECRFDAAACIGFCGDGIVASSEGEVCDGEFALAATCFELGADLGTPGCSDGCSVETRSCTRFHWPIENSGTLAALSALHAEGETRAFAAGDATVVEFDGTSWRPSEVAAGITIHDVYSADGEVWVVGEDDRQGGIIYNRVGQVWSSVDMSQLGVVGPLRAIDGRSAVDLWVLGDGELLRNIGGGWTRVSVSTQSYGIDVVALPAGQAWTVGAIDPFSDGGSAVRTDGDSQLASFDFGMRPGRAALAPDGRLLVPLESELTLTGALAILASGTVTVSTAPGPVGFAVARADDEVFVGGTDGAFYRFAGDSWLPLDFGSTSGITAMSGVVGGTHWVAGLGGRLQRYGGAARVLRGDPQLQGSGAVFQHGGRACATGNYRAALGSSQAASTSSVALWDGEDGVAESVRGGAYLDVAPLPDGPPTVYFSSGLDDFEGDAVGAVGQWRDGQIELVPTGKEVIDLGMGLEITIPRTITKIVAVRDGFAIAAASKRVFVMSDAGGAFATVGFTDLAQSVRDLAVVGDDDVIVVTITGELVRGDPDGLLEPLDPPPPFEDDDQPVVVWAAANDIAIGTANGEVWRDDGSGWQRVLARFGNGLAGLTGPSYDDLYALFSAADGQSRLYHHDGVVWSPVRTVIEPDFVCANGGSLTITRLNGADAEEIRRSR